MKIASDELNDRAATTLFALRQMGASDREISRALIGIVVYLAATSDDRDGFLIDLAAASTAIANRAHDTKEAN